jgi:hypothetical protein
MDAQTPLVECPRCKLYTRNPDEHLLGPPKGDHSGRLMRYCTPEGLVVREVPPAPPREAGWGWHPGTDGRLAYGREP